MVLACASSRLNLLLKSGPGVTLDEYESKEFNLLYADFRGMIPRLTWDIRDNRVTWKFPLADASAMKERLLKTLYELEYSSPLPNMRLGPVSFDLAEQHVMQSRLYSILLYEIIPGRLINLLS